MAGGGAPAPPAPPPQALSRQKAQIEFKNKRDLFIASPQGLAGAPRNFRYPFMRKQDPKSIMPEQPFSGTRRWRRFDDRYWVYNPDKTEGQH